MYDIGGFSRIDQDGIFHYAPYGVYAPDYTLLISDQATYTYPIDGWIWFNTEVEARNYFNIPLDAVEP